MKSTIIARVSVLISFGMLLGAVAANAVTAPIINVTVNTKLLDVATADAIAEELLTEKSYICLKQIIYKESRGNPKSANKASSAKGIGQLLSSTYRNIGMEHSEDEAAQLIAMLAYIGRKYGSGGPCAAWKHHIRHNWY